MTTEQLVKATKNAFRALAEQMTREVHRPIVQGPRTAPKNWLTYLEKRKVKRA